MLEQIWKDSKSKGESVSVKFKQYDNGYYSSLKFNSTGRILFGIGRQDNRIFAMDVDSKRVIGK